MSNKHNDRSNNTKQDKSEPAEHLREDLNKGVYDSVHNNDVRNSMPPPRNPNRQNQDNDSSEGS